MADENNVPNRKVVVGGVAAGGMTILVWAIEEFGHIKIPPEVAVAGAGIVVFILQYLVPNAEV